ncbi:alpha/beta hydrolase [Tessaracoccus antarcticus]|uniref:Alpha/beta hydrolase n=1 Tax=Tessaracoccus antarcticus TaxID=2479848 RepID=A0A3M0G882_9ACTN|nr:alpha/beta hydrolase [Tessaracoccus antarcticus]RMB61175.1 alpha/beta hydrolase [Tessaracoccus antarcticus]
MASNSVPPKGSKVRRVITRVLLGLFALLGLVTAGFLVWANVGVMQAEPGPLAAVESDPSITVVENPEAVVMSPTDQKSTKGLVFIPGAKVTAESYLSNLSGIVADDGVTVVITKPTLNLAFFDLRPLTTFTTLAPDVDQWWVGGHSLGGVKACQFAAQPDVQGLVLFGSYCANDLSGSDLPVLSLGGSNDGLSTPAKIKDASVRLPADAEFIQIDGANHARFGDYGVQSGDGTATISSEEMRSRLTEDISAFLKAA